MKAWSLPGLLLLALCAASCSCERDDATSLTKNPNATPPDRLQPGEQLPGRPRVFGIDVPKGMRVAARFPEFAQLSGHVELDDVANYFGKHLITGHVELGNNRAVFPRAYVKGDETKRIYRIEIVSERSLTSVNIRDITPPPVVQGRNEQERWQRAGRNLDGSMTDRLKVY